MGGRLGGKQRCGLVKDVCVGELPVVGCLTLSLKRENVPSQLSKKLDQLVLIFLSESYGLFYH